MHVATFAAALRHRATLIQAAALVASCSVHSGGVQLQHLGAGSPLDCAGPGNAAATPHMHGLALRTFRVARDSERVKRNTTPTRHHCIVRERVRERVLHSVGVQPAARSRLTSRSRSHAREAQ